jgi:hypothetical protein
MPDPEEAMKYYENKANQEKLRRDEEHYKVLRQDYEEKLNELREIDGGLIPGMFQTNKKTRDFVRTLRRSYREELERAACIEAQMYAFERVVREAFGSKLTEELIDSMWEDDLPNRILAKIWPNASELELTKE